MTILVTGATGFLGEHVVRCLVTDGVVPEKIRCLARSHSPTLAALGVEQVRVDVLDDAGLSSAFRGVTHVYHLAGLVSRSPNDGQKMMRLHVDGTRKVLIQAKDAHVKRVVVASSSGTVAVSRDQSIHDESDDYATEVVAGWPYYASKVYQEKTALELARTLGVDVVLVNPSLLLGPGDRRGSSTADVLRFLRKQVPFVPRGGVNFVDVRDAARATVSAMARGASGQKYLLGGPNWTFAEFFDRLGRAANLTTPRFKIPNRWATMGAGLMEQVYRSRGAEPPIDKISAEMAQHFWWVDSSKAAKELDFEQRDPSLTLVDTVNYLRQSIAAR